MQRRTRIITLMIVILGIGWYLFRPELLFVNRSVNEEFPGRASAQKVAPDTKPVVLSEGRFHGVAHEGSGMATLYQFPDGKRVLRFTEFTTSNGPDLFVYMVAAADANDNATVKRVGFISLGTLKGNVGDQNYDLPPDLDLTKYRSVSIWCRRFGVNFAIAPLTPQHN